ncbi:Uncharacterized conserved protein [Sulfitobacter brevis]|uniref:Uncharacterized conserved protein n=1 Tax=Sulfitobacter brevis TaxID=74348 RepID=A0A1I1ZQX3_9RHOB|nr:Uncharacterized conserved protein [Sulfitobacter brevis]
MAEFNETLNAHLAGGITTLCRAWLITRRDGVIHAFTDHDLPLEFDGITFRADSGLSARAIAQSTGLSVDDTETMGRSAMHQSVRTRLSRGGLIARRCRLGW